MYSDVFLREVSIQYFIILRRNCICQKPNSRHASRDAIDDVKQLHVCLINILKSFQNNNGHNRAMRAAV